MIKRQTALHIDKAENPSTTTNDVLGTMYNPADPDASYRASLQIEVLTVRDPDGDTDVHVYVNGTPIRCLGEDVDAGAGHDRQDWDDTTREIEQGTTYSQSFREAVVEARDQPPGAQYIVDHDGRPPGW